MMLEAKTSILQVMEVHNMTGSQNMSQELKPFLFQLFQDHFMSACNTQPFSTILVTQRIVVIHLSNHISGIPFIFPRCS